MTFIVKVWEYQLTSHSISAVISKLHDNYRHPQASTVRNKEIVVLHTKIKIYMSWKSKLARIK